MKYRLQNRYQDEDWEWLAEEFDTEVEAVSFAHACSCDAICFGMVRVISPTGQIIVEYSAGEGAHVRRAMQIFSTCPASKYHISPNGARPGSFIHDAEKWALSEGLTIPLAWKHQRMFHGMLEDFRKIKRCSATAVEARAS